jgi:hypothetical protein
LEICTLKSVVRGHHYHGLEIRIHLLSATTVAAVAAENQTPIQVNRIGSAFRTLFLRILPKHWRNPKHLKILSLTA